ncbi:MAG: DUF421 domain-containing protein [Thermoanaerobacterales bacterium]
MEIVARATVVFFFLLLLTRGLKRRVLADLSPFEMILLVVLGDIVQPGVTQEDSSLTGAVLAACTFGFWVTVTTWATWRSRRLRRVVDGVPIVLVEDGRPVEAALRLEQMPVEELFEAARQQGIDDLSAIRLAVLEPSGRISIIRRS